MTFFFFINFSLKAANLLKHIYSVYIVWFLLIFPYHCILFDHNWLLKKINMQKIFTLLFSAVLIMGSTFKPINGIDDVISALRTGNATEVGKYIDENVELSLPDKSDNYSKAQAIMILKDFFVNNVVSGF